MKLSEFDDLPVGSIVALRRLTTDPDFLFRRTDKSIWVRIEDEIPFDHTTMSAYARSLRRLSDLEILAMETK